MIILLHKYRKKEFLIKIKEICRYASTRKQNNKTKLNKEKFESFTPEMLKAKSKELSQLKKLHEQDIKKSLKKLQDKKIPEGFEIEELMSKINEINDDLRSIWSLINKKSS